MLAIDIGSTWYNNYKSGSETWVTDTIVDTWYTLIKLGLGMIISALCAPIPSVGFLVGAVLSIAADNLLDYIIEGEVLDNVKKWAAETENKIANARINFGVLVGFSMKVRLNYA